MGEMKGFYFYLAKCSVASPMTPTSVTFQQHSPDCMGESHFGQGEVAGCMDGGASDACNVARCGQHAAERAPVDLLAHRDIQGTYISIWSVSLRPSHGPLELQWSVAQLMVTYTDSSYNFILGLVDVISQM